MVSQLEPQGVAVTADRTGAATGGRMISSLSGLLGDVADVRQARSRCLRCCPRVAVIPPRDRLIGHAAGTGLLIPS